MPKTDKDYIIHNQTSLKRCALSPKTPIDFFKWSPWSVFQNTPGFCSHAPQI